MVKPQSVGKNANSVDEPDDDFKQYTIYSYIGEVMFHFSFLFIYILFMRKKWHFVVYLFLALM